MICAMLVLGIRHPVVWYREALGTLLCGTERH